MTVQSQSTASDQTNFRHLVGDIAWFGLALAATSRFLSVYAIRLGASSIELGLISALPALILVLSASFGSWWTRRYGNPARSLFLPGLGMRFLFLLPAFAPFLPIQWQPIWLILAVSIPALPQGVASVTFLIMMRGAIDPTHMTRLLSLRQLALNLTIAAGAVVFGIWLETAPYPLNYQVMFLLAFLFSLVSLIHCIRIRVDVPEVAPVAKVSTINAWRSSHFQKVAFVAVVLHVSFLLLNSVLPFYLVARMGADEGFMALFALIELTAGAIGSLVAPRLTRWVGSTRRMIALMIAGTALNAFIIAFAPNLTIALFAAVFSGFCWTAGAGVGLFSFFVENTPADEMPAYSTAYNQVIGLAVFAGPMIGSLLATNANSLIPLIIFGGVLRLVAAPLIASPGLLKRVMRRQPRPAVSDTTLAFSDVPADTQPRAL